MQKREWMNGKNLAAWAGLSLLFVATRALLVLPWMLISVPRNDGLTTVLRGAATLLIWVFAVLPEHRGFGIAGRMLAVPIAEAARKETSEFTLEVRAGNIPAIRTYEKLGFRTEGCRPGFYEAPKEDALIMWRRPHAVTDTESDTEDGGAETAPAGSDFR